MKIRSRRNFIAVAVAFLVFPSLVALQAFGDPTPLRVTVFQDSHQCSQSGSPLLHVAIYVVNNAAWAVTVGGGPSRNLVPNNLVVSSFDLVETTASGSPISTGTFPVSYTLTYPIPHVSPATWTSTTPVSPDAVGRADRWNPIVLPGETVAINYFAYVCDPSILLGVHKFQVIVHGTFQGSPVSISTIFSFLVVP